MGSGSASVLLAARFAYVVSFLVCCDEALFASSSSCGFDPRLGAVTSAVDGAVHYALMNGNIPGAKSTAWTGTAMYLPGR